jgi:hypothetical protein
MLTTLFGSREYHCGAFGVRFVHNSYCTLWRAVGGFDDLGRNLTHRVLLIVVEQHVMRLSEDVRGTYINTYRRDSVISHKTSLSLVE